MSTLTKEWLLKTIAELEEERDATPGAVNEDAAMSLAAMKLALASLEAEAVAWRYRFVHTPKSEEHGSPFTTDWVLAHSEDECNPSDCFERQPLYIAPPAPVAMKDHQIRDLVNELRDIAVEYYGTQQLRERIAKTVRAAMLQGADGKPELTVWYGAMPETNGKTNWTAMLHRKGHHPWEGITIDRSEYPGRVRYEADRMRHLIGELADEPDILTYDSDAHTGYVEPVTTAYKLPFEQWLSQQTGTIDVECGCVMTEVFFHWLRVAYEAGNYPVIPDGWVLVPIEPTYQMCEAMGLQWESPRFPDRYKAMLAAVKK
ncbi:hypothetical protein [Enterobacter hormaechei]|uniref:hypothetical protein n=1 Tax=Enterobacter hormaechei TaxID=158836 RepID=UPI001F4E8817|nr:hypothetical protein [Enterobacter hormaechei]MCH9418332.1 hypothetical protein [Enterobacter hormaechei]